METKLQQTIKNVAERFQRQLLSILFFSCLFGILGILIPDFYYKYFDTRAYYTVQSAIVNGGDLKPCGYVDISLVEHADYDLQGLAIVDVVLVRADEPNLEERTITDLVNIKAGDTTTTHTYPLVCALRGGDYFLKASVRYEVRGNAKVTTWQSNRFVVKIP